MALPTHQRWLRIAAAAAGAFIALGVALDAISNSQQLVTRQRALAGTILILVCILIASLYTRRHGLTWSVNGSLVTVRKLGLLPFAGAAGAVALLWLPRLLTVPAQPPPPSVADLQPSFRVVPGPGTSQVVFATTSGFDLELMESAAHQATVARDSFNEGQAHFDAQRYREAADAFQRSIETLPTLSALLNRGLSLRYLPDYPAAEGVLRTGLRRASEQRRELFAAHFGLYLSSVLLGQGRVDDAEFTVTHALIIYKRLGDELGQANARVNVSSILSTRGKWDGAVKELLIAGGAYANAGNPLGQANVSNNLAGIYAGRLKLAEATKAYSAALALYESVNNQSGIARATDGLATLHLVQGRLVEALATAQIALDRAVRQADGERRVSALLTIAAVHNEQGRFSEAITVGSTALQLARDLEATQMEATANILLAMANRHLARFGEAHDHAGRAVKAFKKIGAPSGTASALSEVGFCYLSEHRLAEARSAFRNALAITDANGLLWEQAKAQTGLGMTEAALGHNERALEIVLPAQAFFARTGLKVEAARQAESLVTSLNTQLRNSRK